MANSCIKSVWPLWCYLVSNGGNKFTNYSIGIKHKHIFKQTTTVFVVFSQKRELLLWWNFQRLDIVTGEIYHPVGYTILNKIINAPCGTLKLLLALGVAKYIKSYKIHVVVQYATDYCPLEHDNYKTISAHLGSPISCYINNLHGAFIFLLSVYRHNFKWILYFSCTFLYLVLLYASYVVLLLPFHVQFTRVQSECLARYRGYCDDQGLFL